MKKATVLITEYWGHFDGELRFMVTSNDSCFPRSITKDTRKEAEEVADHFFGVGNWKEYESK